SKRNCELQIVSGVGFCPCRLHAIYWSAVATESFGEDLYRLAVGSRRDDRHGTADQPRLRTALRDGTRIDQKFQAVLAAEDVLIRHADRDVKVVVVTSRRELCRCVGWAGPAFRVADYDRFIGKANRL